MAPCLSENPSIDSSPGPFTFRPFITSSASLPSTSFPLISPSPARAASLLLSRPSSAHQAHHSLVSGPLFLLLFAWNVLTPDVSARLVPFPKFLLKCCHLNKAFPIHDILNYNPHPQQQTIFSLPYSTFSFYST